MGTCEESRDETMVLKPRHPAGYMHSPESARPSASETEAPVPQQSARLAAPGTLIAVHSRRHMSLEAPTSRVNLGRAGQ